MKSGRRFRLACAILIGLLSGPAARAQVATSPPVATPAQPEPAKDPLGRDTPRGTVLGFMDAARAGRDDVAQQYLNTKLRDEEAVELAKELFEVLDTRLSARLNSLSDRPEGSRPNPLNPDQDIVGAITTANGPLDLVLERVTRGAPARPVWLFSRQTLELIPDVYAELDLVPVERFLPTFVTRPRVFGIRLFAWLLLLLIVPVLYFLLGLLSRLLGPVVGAWRRRRGHGTETTANLAPGPIRLLLLAVLIRWLLGSVEVRLPERVFWSGIATNLTLAGLAWGLLLLNGSLERRLQRRLQISGRGDMAGMLRLARRVVDGLVIAAGVLVLLDYFGVDPTAALAGLGIGGIAVALAAQKTLENVIGGLSIIFDQAVRVGDFLKFGDTLGTVDYIGMRSTRIRTLDRTMLSVPNGQIANASIETLSARDKFWFRHVVGLGYETTASQLRAILDAIHGHMKGHPMIDRQESIRARLFRLGAFSLDVEVFAYIRARDWEAFLEAQQALLVEIIEIVERCGASIALPSQTLHLIEGGGGAPGAGPIDVTRSARSERQPT